MSFVCKVCNEKQINGTKAHMVVLQKRAKHYPPRPKAYKVFDEEEQEYTFKEDPGGDGFEAVKEVQACKACAEIHAMREKYAGQEAARREAIIRKKRKEEKRQQEMEANRALVARIVAREAGRDLTTGHIIRQEISKK